jgi:hypothetical protein
MAVATLVAITVVAVHAVSAGASGCDGGNGIRLPVSVATDIAPAVREAANRWANSSKPQVNGACISVEITAVAPAQVANLLAVRAGDPIDVAAKPAPSPSERDVPAVWIPDSSAWLSRLRQVDQNLFESESPSIAMSPVVLAMPDPVARAILGGPNKSVDRAALAQMLADPEHKVTVGVIDPRADAASLAGASMLNDLIVASPADLTDLVGVFRAIVSVKDRAALIKAFSGQIQAAAMTEQAVLDFDATTPPVPLAAVPIVPSPAAMDFPVATITGKSRAVSRAAALFRTAMAGSQFRDIFARNGFREPDGTTVGGFPAGHGAAADAVNAPSLADPATFVQALGVWSAANSPSRVLALIDTTSSMGQGAQTPVGFLSRLELLQRAALAGLDLFTPDSQVGMWTYASQVQPAVPIGTLDQSQVVRLQTELHGLRLSGTNTCGLYEAILSAYQEVKRTYQDDRDSTIVVFTDGRNNKSGSMSLERLLIQLENLTDTTKPVNVILLGIGADADQDSLHRIAEATGGRDWKVQDPRQIGEIFLEALLAGAAAR